MSLQLPGFLNQAAAAKRGGEAPDRRCPCQPGRRADARIGFQRTRDAMSARVSARPTPLQEQWHDPRFARFPRAERRFSSERPQRSAIHANTAQNCPFLSLGTGALPGRSFAPRQSPSPLNSNTSGQRHLGVFTFFVPPPARLPPDSRAPASAVDAGDACPRGCPLHMARKRRARLIWLES